MAQAAAVATADEFDAAFDEAAKEGEQTLQGGDKEPAKEPAKGAEVPPKKDEPVVPDKGAEVPPKKDEPVIPPAKEPAEIIAEALAKSQEAAEQRTAAKIKKDAEDAAAAKAVKDAEDAAAAREAPYEPTAEEAAAMMVFQKEFPNEYKAMEARLKAQQKAFDGQVYKAVQEVNEKIAKLEQGLTPLRQTVESGQQNAHFLAIKAAHTDYDEVVKALPAWIEKLPAHRRIGAQAVYEGGDVASVIALFDDYKKENNIVTPDPEKKEEVEAPVKPALKKPTAEEIASGAPVGSRRAAPSVRGEPDKDDYDAAWAEATKDE